VRLKDTGADGFIPASTLGQDYYRFVEEMQAMVGDRTGETFRIGDDVEVRLLEAAPIAGALRFELLSEGSRGVPSSGKRGRKGPSRARGKVGAPRKPTRKKR
jgi:ribonuclease R